MHLRYREADIYLFIAAELNQFLFNEFIIEVSKPPGNEFPFGFYAGGFIQLVITAEIILIQ